MLADLDVGQHDGSGAYLGACPNTRAPREHRTRTDHRAVTDVYVVLYHGGGVNQ